MINHKENKKEWQNLKQNAKEELGETNNHNEKKNNSEPKTKEEKRKKALKDNVIIINYFVFMF